MMLKNHWRIAWRFLTRNKVFTAIHILGLSLGICGCLVLFLITHYEFSFDRDWPDGDRVYRIVGAHHSPDGQENFMNSPYYDVAGFETQIPGFEAKAAVYERHLKIVVQKMGEAAKEFDNQIPNSYQATTAFTRPGYFNIFRYTWLEGDGRSLDQPNNVVLTENRARLYFGNIPLSEMMGKTVVYDDSLTDACFGDRERSGRPIPIFGIPIFFPLITATHSFLKNRIRDC